jgi:Protein of unknown function (DUF664)
MVDDMKDTLVGYLLAGREALRWKLDGLGEYDLRRPLTPTGTNLLGLAQHTVSVGAGYLGDVFGRPFGEPLRGFTDDSEPNDDLWVPATVATADVLSLWDRGWAHADATVEALRLDAVGDVPWWPDERRHPTLHTVLVHVIAEVHRHAGHADIVRESIDGSAGMRPDVTNLADVDDAFWPGYVERLEDAARRAAGR